jgi:hypothetical protein
MLPGITGEGSSGTGTGGIGSTLSDLGGLNKDHELIKHVHGVGILNEQSNNNPHALQSIIGGS